MRSSLDGDPPKECSCLTSFGGASLTLGLLHLSCSPIAIATDFIALRSFSPSSPGLCPTLSTELPGVASMSVYWEMLDGLGLAQYHDTLVDHAFEDWNSLRGITESDLHALGFKLGHRRVLQQAISDRLRAQVRQPPVDSASQVSQHGTAGERSEEDTPGHTDGRSKVDVGHNAAPAAGVKRKYKRHPKPDEFAPERPPSAYVLFSNQVRETLQHDDLSFTEIAKVVGQRWQALSPKEREPFERRSQTLKETYYANLAEYKKTDEYARYQEYLADFKAKHNPPSPGEGKRPKKSETENDSGRNGSFDTVSHSHGSTHYTGSWGSDASDPSRRPSTASTTTVNSPTFNHSGTSQSTFDYSSRTSYRESASDTRGDSPTFSPPYTSNGGYKYSPSLPLPVTLNFRPLDISPAGRPAVPSFSTYGQSTASNGPRYSSPLDPPQHQGSTNLDRRRGVTAIGYRPPLVHDDTTGSTSSSSYGGSASLTMPRPLPDASGRLPNRKLPTPVLTRKTGHSTTDLLPSMVSPGNDCNVHPNMAALLKATEHMASFEPSSAGEQRAVSGRSKASFEQSAASQGKREDRPA